MLKLVGCRVRIAVIFTSRYIQMPNWIEDYDVVYCLMLLGIVISTNHMPAYILHSLGAVTARVLYNEKHSLSIDHASQTTRYTPVLNWPSSHNLPINFGQSMHAMHFR